MPGTERWTPTTWGEHEQPEPEQLAEWLRVCTPEERLRYVTRAQASFDRAADCVMQMHEETIEEQRRIIEHYRNGRYRRLGQVVRQ